MLRNLKIESNDLNHVFSSLNSCFLCSWCSMEFFFWIVFHQCVLLLVEPHGSVSVCLTSTSKEIVKPCLDDPTCIPIFAQLILCFKSFFFLIFELNLIMFYSHTLHGKLNLLSIIYQTLLLMNKNKHKVLI